MGWRGAIRSINAEIRRQEREAQRRAREAERRWKEAQKVEAQLQAEYEVEAHETQIDLLTSVHRECADPIDWSAVRARPAPKKPRKPKPVDTSRSSDARSALEAYKPGFFARLFGLQGARRALEAEIAEAEAAEADLEARAAADHAQRLDAWRESTRVWEETCELAERILAGDLQAYIEVIQGTGCFRELAGLIGDQSVSLHVSLSHAEVTLDVQEDSVVPREQKSLTARGKVSTKKLPEKKRAELYQDYVCGAALRAARELMAVTPLPAVLVHVRTSLLNTASGHFEPSTIVSVFCPRDRMLEVAWERVDASDLVETFLHRMRVKRGQGFTSVEPLSPPD